ncbi:YybH family protein [Sphingomonas sp. MS122]|uniref:YybH family protein n=1 Tax=Sphingomonas sp. MS122 TaxID=3412683 RepID=UPI003C2D1374
MKILTTLVLCLAGLMLAIAPFAAYAASSQDADLAELVERAATAHERLMRGDIAGYRQVMQVTSDFTLMDPFGGKPTGAPPSDDHWARIGQLFQGGRDAVFNLIASYITSNLAVLVANEHAHVAFGGLPAQNWSLRVTLVFRKEDSRWLLAHRHADPLASGISREQAAALASGDRP